MLTAEQKAQYKEHGFILVEDALSQDQLIKLQQVTTSLINQSASVTESNEIFDLDEGHSKNNPRLTRIKLPHTLDPIYWEIIRSEL